MIPFLESIGTIIIHNILPIAIIIVCGYFLEKKFVFDIRILSKLNFYIFIPCFMFVNLYTIDFDIQFIKLIIAEIVFMVIANILSGFYAKGRGLSLDAKNHFQNAVVFNNMGNVGLPLIMLLFSGSMYLVDGNPIYLNLAVSVQLILMTTQNIGMNSWGFYKGFSANEAGTKESLKRIMTIPMIYAVIIVIVLRLFSLDFRTNPIYVAMEYIEGGMIPVALLALGMQVGKTGINLKKARNYEAVFAKMIISFVIALLINLVFGFTGVIAQVVMIASMTPVGINVALVSIEAKSQEEFTSQVVVLSTVIALLILPFVLYATQLLYPI